MADKKKKKKHNICEFYGQEPIKCTLTKVPFQFVTYKSECKLVR